MASTSNPLVSVITAAYNVGPFIETAIQSVLNQTFTDLELIVVNDGSTDDGPRKIAAFQHPRLRVIHQPNRGSAEARNAGVAIARGQYLAFLDGDDAWEPRKLELQLAIHASHPETDLSYTLSHLMNEAGKVIGVMSGDVDGPVSFLDLLRENRTRNGSCVMLRAAAIREAGGFDPTLRSSVDYDCWLRIALLRPNNVLCLARPLTYYRRRKGQITSDWRRMRASQTMMFDRYEQFAPQHLWVRTRAESDRCRYYAFLAYEEGAYGEAMRLLGEGFRKAPAAFLRDSRSWTMGAAILTGALLPGSIHRWVERSALAVRARILAALYKD